MPEKMGCAYQFDPVAGRRGKMPNAVLTTRVVVGPVRTAQLADGFRDLVLTAAYSRSLSSFTYITGR